MKNNSGFTLMELIITLAILSILASMVFLNVNILGNYREEAELKEFISDINYARNHSITESTTYSISIKRYTNSYTISKNVRENSSEGVKIIKTKKFKDGIEIAYTSFHGDSIRFYINGAPKSAGTVKLKNSKNEIIDITVGVATGKVRVYFR